MTNQELKKLIIAFGENLKVSTMECIDDALCDAFKAQLNMQQPETILNHVHELEDKIKSLEAQLKEAQNKEPEVKEVEKEVQVEVEVIPEEVEEELDSLKKSLKEKEEELNDTMNILEATLDEKDQLEARCTELYEQNEYLLNQLEQPEEVTFEEPEEVSNEDILANSINEEVDEEAILNQLEKSLEQVAIEEPEKK